jgi:hypothetical protein
VATGSDYPLPGEFTSTQVLVGDTDAATESLNQIYDESA